MSAKVRMAVDFIVIMLAGMIALYWSESVLASIAFAACTAAYGTWCFIDGMLK